MKTGLIHLSFNLMSIRYQVENVYHFVVKRGKEYEKYKPSSYTSSIVALHSTLNAKLGRHKLVHLLKQKKKILQSQFHCEE